MTLIEDVGDNTCSCVGKHVPLPHKLYLLDGIYVCPTTYHNIMSLLDEYKRAKMVPPGSVRKHYSDFVQQIASRLYSL